MPQTGRNLLRPVAAGDDQIDAVESGETRTPTFAAPARDPRTDTTNAFRDAVVRAFPPAAGSFDNVPFIRTFLAACRGFQDDLPIHYPRATVNGQPGPPSPDGESFKWFVANERKGAQYALRDLASDTGLPTLGERTTGGGGHLRQGGRSRRARGGEHQQRR